MLREALSGFGWFTLYYIIGATLLILMRTYLNLPKELFRKMLHMVCVLSVFVLLYAFDTWYSAALCAILFAIVIYPIIHWLERFPKVMELLIQRRSGEIKFSLMIVFFMMAVLIFVFWGLLGPSWKYIIIAAIMAWGLGDAAAALVGKHLGKRHFKLRFADKKKTVEGSLSMCIVSALAILMTLLISTALPWYWCLLAALIAAPIASYVELVSGACMDTLTVPLATAAPLFLLVFLASRIGGF